MTEGNVAFESTSVSPEALANLGEGHIAYVKQIRSEDVPGLFPQAPKDRAGTEAFRAPRRRRHADHADRQPRGRDRERLEQRIAGRQRTLTTADNRIRDARVLPSVWSRTALAFF